MQVMHSTPVVFAPLETSAATTTKISTTTSAEVASSSATKVSAATSAKISSSLTLVPALIASLILTTLFAQLVANQTTGCCP